MKQNFDLIVIGTGPGGASVASKCASAGWSVVIVDERDYGGTCPLRGCDPKKVLVGAAELIDHNKRMQGNGIHANSEIDWTELIKFKETFTQPVPESMEKSLADAGVTTFHGTAQFVSDKEIQINGQKLTGDKFVIATGATPMPLPIDGAEHLTTSDQFLDLKQLPKHIVFVGGGYISFEFAHIAARAGAEVHIVHRSAKPLKAFDQELVNKLMEKSKEIGIDIHLNAPVKSIEKKENGYTVNSDDASWDTDMVVHGAGRVPAIKKLKLDKGSIGSGKSGVTVNKFLQSTSNERVYAIGDVADTDGPPLTPVANIDASTVISNLLKGNQKEAVYKGIPSVTFTVPKLATVGMSAESAKGLDKEININYIDTSDWFTYSRTNETHAAVKIITDKNSDRILGAHILSDEADELINFFSMAIQLDLTTKQLKGINFAYPTTASDIGSLL
ncbi:pyridine nucleotide-disulfide oxidoreductase [Virgibacillus phasianinus]|uniref:Pyridine nucleotide-disulfide oxidoreductase n=1 Tax=Virgibacillus phasianinus TaxID=2017483 RepID=A0A220TZC2_9BACI|nr:NAD(P)/FAD-dependent oxidoreductase [Virgibacillus phasianinus]ASK61026.1 pyridine nucleotide-disulfide oxidoreductase [Virgibacillus phasianinus]